MVKYSMKNDKLISIVTPCFNEEDSIENCVIKVREMFNAELPEYDYEHIFCDNCSTDSTVGILKNLAAEDSRIKVIVNSRNFGPFRSMFNGLKRSSGDAVIPFLPVDLQDPPHLIPEFVRHWESGVDIVAGARETRAERLTMRLARKLFYKGLRFFSDFESPESVGEFQLIDRKVASAVLTYNDTYPFVRTMIASVGFKRLIIPYHWAEREHGNSKLSIRNLIDQSFVGLFSFSTIPLRAAIWLGLMMAILSFFYSIYVLITAVFGLAEAPSGIFTLLVGFFFLFSVLFLFIGILGEYVLQIHRQVRGGSVVFETELINFPEPDEET